MSMRFGIIGAGMIANFHAQALGQMTDGVLHSVFDRSEERAKAFAADKGIKTSATLEEFLADPELDIVTIGTPSGAHMEPAVAAMKAGKHVICEKPLEITTERIDEMMVIAKKHGVMLAAVLNRRFNPAITAAKKAVDQGRFGKLTMCDAYVKWYRPQSYYDSGAWRGTWALDGGGALMNQSIHTIDQLLYLAGPIKQLTASMACLAHENIEVEDTVVAAVEFASGARGVIQGSTACYSKTGLPAEVFLGGDKGSASVTDETIRLWDFETAAPEDARIESELMQQAEQGLGANDPTAIHADGHVRNFQEVIDAIKNKRPCLVDAAEARKAVAVIRAIYESAQNNSKVVTL